MQTRLDTLEHMGIEVWRLRQSPPAMATTEEVQSDQNVIKATPVENNAETEPTPPSPESHVPRFRIAFLHYESVGFCLSLAPEADLPRRFCDDLARVLGGDVGAVRFQMLEWPMLNTSGIDQSEAAARQVVTQKFSQLPSRVVVLGEVPAYFGPLENIEAEKPTNIGRQQYLQIPELADLMQSSIRKRQLLSILKSWG